MDVVGFVGTSSLSVLLRLVRTKNQWGLKHWRHAVVAGAQQGRVGGRKLHGKIKFRANRAAKELRLSTSSGWPRRASGRKMEAPVGAYASLRLLNVEALVGTQLGVGRIPQRGENAGGASTSMVLRFTQSQQRWKQRRHQSLRIEQRRMRRAP